MQHSHLSEARRQAKICNACRYCEGFCSVFPALQRLRDFKDGDLIRLANLCHDCRGCYYSCQYTAPHEFNLNFPKALAEARQRSWEQFAWPTPFARAFQRSGVKIAALLLLACIFIFAVALFVPASGGAGFYSIISHEVMVAIFTPALLTPLACIAISIKRYWRSTSGGRVDWLQIVAGLNSAIQMKNLAAGHEQGCNFEDRDRYSQARRYAHHLLFYGFLLCFASTSSGAVLHYAFDQPAPYPIWSLPKMFGITGGVAMSAGGIWMAVLKWKAEKLHGDKRVWGGEMAFVALLCVVAMSGLALYGLGRLGIEWLTALLVFHLGSVVALFILMPYSKMVHGFFRLAALIQNAGKRQDRTEIKHLV